jgi:hypothetical protein
MPKYFAQVAKWRKGKAVPLDVPLIKEWEKYVLMLQLCFNGEQRCSDQNGIKERMIDQRLWRW